MMDWVVVHAASAATVLGTEIVVAHGDAVAEDITARGYVTNELSELLPGTHASQIYRMGRLVLHHSTMATVKVQACLRNEGSTAWPGSPELRIVAGEAFGCDQLVLDPLLAGETT